MREPSGREGGLKVSVRWQDGHVFHQGGRYSQPAVTADIERFPMLSGVMPDGETAFNVYQCLAIVEEAQLLAQEILSTDERSSLTEIVGFCAAGVNGGVDRQLWFMSPDSDDGVTRWGGPYTLFDVPGDSLPPSTQRAEIRDADGTVVHRGGVVQRRAISTDPDLYPIFSTIPLRGEASIGHDEARAFLEEIIRLPRWYRHGEYPSEAERQSLMDLAGLVVMWLMADPGRSLWFVDMATESP